MTDSEVEPIWTDDTEPDWSATFLRSLAVLFVVLWWLLTVRWLGPWAIAATGLLAAAFALTKRNART